MPAFLALACGNVHALDRTWIGGNVDWLDGGTTANWSPADEPDADDRAIFNTTNTVSLGSNNTVNGLALSGGIDLLTADFDLTVDGLTEVAGASTTLVIGGAASVLDTDDLTVNASGTVELAGGTLTLDQEAGTSVLDLNAGGAFFGNGTVNFADVPGGITAQGINDGTLTALSRPVIIFGAPPVGTLSINDSSANTRFDLDGTGEAGVVNVNRNQTLDLNIPLADAFHGDLNLYHNTTFDSVAAWTMAGGTLDVDNGFVDGGILGTDIPAGIATIDGGTFTLSGGILSVVDTDGTLRFDTNVNLSGGTLSNSGKTIFNGTTSITSAAALAPATSPSSIEISGTTTLSDAAGDFNWDGPAGASTTVLGSGAFNLTVNQVDAGNDIFNGTLNLNDNGDLFVNNAANAWTLANTLNKNNAGTSVVSGDRVIVTGVINVAAGTLDLPVVTTQPTANITATGALIFGGGSEFGGAASIGGAGSLLMEGSSVVTANTTVATGTFDWDGLGTGTTHTIASGVVFTISSPVLDGDGDMDDPVTLQGSGAQLIVNGPVEWTATADLNCTGLGTSTIGGTSRLVLSGANADLNVTGNTLITAPLILGADSEAIIGGGFTLDPTQSVTYAGTAISGTGAYAPGTTNTVTANSSITTSIFDFDGGSWTVASGALLTVNVIDYDTTATNVFDGTITLDDGDISVTTSDAEFVMDGTLVMTNTGSIPAWDGEPVDIGNDAGALDADLLVSGTGNSDFGSPVDFNSDADVSIAAGATLRFVTSSTVNFDTVNGANNAEFTGPGTMAFNGVVNVNEAATLNLTGGTVDLDGADLVGEFINIDAPFTVNAASFSSFGKVNGVGTNTLDINNSVGTGVLAVNLDNPASEWTLNGPGVMNLVNDNTEATLLAGSAVNLNGTVNVTGDVRSIARLDIAGVVNINTAGQPLRLAGGDTAAATNTLLGGSISGAGLLGADLNRELRGFGTINTDVDFEGNLFADNGTLTVNGTLLDAARVGTRDADGIINLVNAWDTSVASFVQLEGGELKGGTMTINNPNGVSGEGLVSSRLINNVRLRASDGTLVAQTAANDNDWDGAGGTGELQAINAGTLELRDAGAAFGFTGKVGATGGSRVFANGFALDFNPGSTLELTQGTYESTSSTDLGGTVTIGAGGLSTLKVTNNFFLTFETGSTTTLNGNLQLLNNNINIEAGATFAGAGALVIPGSSHLVMDAGANANVLLDLQGAFRPANFNGIGQVTVKDFQMAPSSELFTELIGTGLNQYDRVSVSGIAVVDGYLNLDIDEVSPGVPFVPSVGQTFNILSASGGVIGKFDALDVSGMPAGLTFKINYLPTIVQVEVIAGSEFETWINLFTSLTNPSDRLRTADPDGDGQNNLVEFALDGDPTNSAPSGKVVAKIAPVASVDALTLTFPVRYGNPFMDPPGGEFLVVGLTTPNLRVKAQATDDLVGFGLTVDRVPDGADATAIQAGMPPLNPGWIYFTCRSPGPVAGDPAEFMRLDVSEAP